MRLNLAAEANSPAHYAKGTPSPPKGLRQVVGVWFQVLLTPLNGVLFTIQSPYWFAIGRQRVFSLGGWSPQFHAGFHETDATLEHLPFFRRNLQDFHLLWFAFPDDSILARKRHWCPQPRAEARFGLFRFRSPLLTESIFLSLPLVT